jgi:hypothetical protein
VAEYSRKDAVPDPIPQQQQGPAAGRSAAAPPHRHRGTAVSRRSQYRHSGLSVLPATGCWLLRTAPPATPTLYGGGRKCHERKREERAATGAPLSLPEAHMDPAAPPLAARPGHHSNAPADVEAPSGTDWNQYKKVLLAGCIGNILEWYDFALYGAFAPVFGRIFFPPCEMTHGPEDMCLSGHDEFHCSIDADHPPPGGIDACCQWDTKNATGCSYNPVEKGMLLKSFATFGAAFIMRPLGGIIMVRI